MSAYTPRGSRRVYTTPACYLLASVNVTCDLPNHRYGEEGRDQAGVVDSADNILNVMITY